MATIWPISAFVPPIASPPPRFAAHVPLAFDQAVLRQLHNDVTAYALALRDMLFAAEPLRNGWLRAVNNSEGRNLPLRVRLLLDGDDELHAIRWETLSDLQGVSFARSQRIFFSRFLASADVAAATVPLGERRRVLVAVAAPHDLVDYGFAPIDAAAEMALARAAFGADLEVDVLGFSFGQAASFKNVLARLREGPRYDLLYLVCHGTRGWG
ncbi:CHAT domain-containing protein [Candidatus Gracilibacteria bacterium]|nr:CHAT domain-containing protein [Candidatus Gracilibacteria bacterium]